MPPASPRLYRSDFQRIAEILLARRPYLPPEQYDALVGAFADYCQCTSDRFDRDRFFASCYHGVQRDPRARALIAAASTAGELFTDAELDPASA